MNLQLILNQIKECEDAALQIPAECDMAIKTKVDDCWELIKFWEMQEKHFKELAKHYKEKAEVRANDVERLQDWILLNMDKFEWDALNGEKHRIKKVVQKRFSKNLEPTADTHALLPHLVKKQETVVTSYSWDMDALKEAYEKEPEVYRVYAETKLSKYLKLS